MNFNANKYCVKECTYVSIRIRVKFEPRAFCIKDYALRGKKSEFPYYYYCYHNVIIAFWYYVMCLCY